MSVEQREGPVPARRDEEVLPVTLVTLGSLGLRAGKSQAFE
jgi:hypothetical protein